MRFQVIDVALLREMKSRSFSLLVRQEAGDSAVLHRRWSREVIDEFARRCREADPGPLALLSVLRQHAPLWADARAAAFEHLCRNPHKSLTMLSMMRDYPGAETDLRIEPGRQAPHQASASAFEFTVRAQGPSRLAAGAHAATALWAMLERGTLPSDAPRKAALGLAFGFSRRG